MVDKLWFSQSIEGLFVRGVGERMTPALRAQLLELGINLKNLKPAYDAAVVTQAIRVTGKALFAEKFEPEQLRAMGALFMHGFAQTLMGKALVQLMKVVGPRRSLQRMERNFRTGGNYIESRFESLGEGKAQVWFNDVSGIPDFYAGIIQRGGEFSGAKNMAITFAPVTNSECTFVVDWKE